MCDSQSGGKVQTYGHQKHLDLEFQHCWQSQFEHAFGWHSRRDTDTILCRSGDDVVSQFRAHSSSGHRRSCHAMSITNNVSIAPARDLQRRSYIFTRMSRHGAQRLFSGVLRGAEADEGVAESSQVA